MIHLRFCTVFIALSVMSCSVSGQSDYLARGVSGFEVDGGFAASSEWSGLFGRAGYSVSGVFDLGLGVAYLTHDRKVAGEDVHSTTFIPHFRWFVVKQQPGGLPLSLSIGAEYQHDSYSSDGLDALDQKMESDFFSLRLTAYHVTSDRRSLRVQPYASLAYHTGELKVSHRLRDTESEDSSELRAQAGVSLFFKRSGRSAFRLSPALTVTSDDLTLLVNLGMILPTSRR